jgi:hypothetical protein
MNRNSNEWSHLVAQAHGLYLRLRDRAHDRAGAVTNQESHESISPELVQQAYQRYQRRVLRRH